MNISDAKEARPVDDSSALVPFGWAPGNYFAICADCKATHGGSDKRSRRCQGCAEALRDAKTAETGPLITPVEGGQGSILPESKIPAVDDGRRVTILERAAWAICAVEGNSEMEWDEAIKSARAALQAIREPDEAVEDDIKWRASLDDCMNAFVPKSAWTAVIDAILSEGAGE